MNTQTNSTPGSLVYNGAVIGQRNDMLSLTSMWIAARSDPQQTPAKWRALPTTKSFVEHLELTIGKSDSDIFVVQNGGRTPGTWAHWQIGLAYAKYLSHDFHMWCNTVVRAHMEGTFGGVRLYGPREVFLTFKNYQGIGKLIGLDRNEASLAANRATIKTIGIDVLATMGTKHLVAETQDELLTPTMIGQRLDGLSAQSINKRLQALGFQVPGTDSHGARTWAPTDLGKPMGRWFDTSKKHNDGSSVQQWKWFASIVDEIRGDTPISIITAAAGELV